MLPVAILIAVVAVLAYIFRGEMLFWAERLINGAAGVNGKPIKWLQGNYAPVHKEITVKDLAVQGILPPALNGAYVRNGPNPLHKPIGGHHWFDGDGMLHAVRIKAGKAAYSNAYVQTSLYKHEKKAGKPLKLKLGALVGKVGIFHYIAFKLRERFGLVDMKDGFGTANTALAFHNKQLLALVENDLPYVVRVNDDSHVETLERQAYGGNLSSPFTAHPKVDPVTGSMYGFGYSLSAPQLHYFVISKGGMVKEDFMITLQDPTMQHDFAMTEDYVIFLDFPLIGNPENLQRGLPMIMFNKQRASRFGVLPKDATSEAKIRWFELSAMYAYHVANAWQEGSQIRIFLCVYDEGFDLEATVSKTFASMNEITLDLDSGNCSMRKLAEEPCCEFPVVPDRLLGRKTRYTYAAEVPVHGDGLGDASGLVKYDLASPDKAVAATLRFGKGCTGGEAVFVPRSTNAAELNGEDDGYLVLFVYDEASKTSDFVVYDAKTFSDKPLATVRLPQRVPYGFHGKHLNAADFQAQFPFDIHFLPDI